jgi:hypothetical protein
LVFKTNDNFFSITCQRNVTLGRVIATWSLFVIEFPVFDFVTITDSILSQQEYNVNNVDAWPWGQNLSLKCSLKGEGW